ncbi:MAG: SMC-Scp complex subunit ScpB [Clostridiaceae bacterium]|jgi:segregation and condensation protein B|nr:SMC-Scp complex subunit ScpB [Clostridiaceae bacterium]
MDTDELRSDSDLMAAAEAVLFAAGDPIAVDVLAKILELSVAETFLLLEQLQRKYQRDVQTGLMLRIIDSKAFLTAKPKLKEIVSRLYRPQNRPALSQASYETLAAIAYNQPCTRAQVEEIRGVNSDGIISRLLERNLIQEVGTLDLPGKPAIFTVTDHFLIEFGLKSAQDLPAADFVMYKTLDALDKQFQYQKYEVED